MKRRWQLWLGLLLLLAAFSTAAVLVGNPDTIAWLRGWPSLDDPSPAFTDPDDTWPRFVLDDENSLVLRLPSETGGTLLIDHQGQVRHRFDLHVIDGRKLGDDYVFLTAREVICRSRNDKERWVVPFAHCPGSGGLAVLPDGDLLAFLYGNSNDSGVKVLRINPQAGETVWQVDCQPLGVCHFSYSHRAKIEISKEKYLKVLSKGSSGSFVELLDLRSGKQLARREFGGMNRRHWLLEWLFGP